MGRKVKEGKLLLGAKDVQILWVILANRYSGEIGTAGYLANRGEKSMG